VSAPSFTCPVCGRTSYNPNDVREQWCGACHGATGHPLPEGAGLRWVLLLGGSIDAGRLLPEPLPERYVHVASGDEYVLRGDAYELEAPA
jgi:hypothetical protein